jgi:hypothetical protein
VTPRASTAAICGVLLAMMAPGCGGAEPRPEAPQRSQAMEGASNRPEDDHGRCDTHGEGREVSEYDTSGDDYPDVRRVFRRVGDPPLTRLILSCREADLNADGIKDVVRYYSDEGRPLREESDRDFDGQMDIITFFQDGHIVRQELDTNADGRVDTKLFFERGHMVRTERDLGARSTASQWRPDRWEYFENDRMVRMGTDLDGDGTVDRWDRDAAWSEQQRAAEQADGAADSGDAAGDASGDDASGDDAGAESGADAG